MPFRVMSVIGTRPEAIKMAPVIQRLEADPQSFVSRVVSAAQHREMLDQVLSVFRIKADWDLGVMESGQTLSGVTAKILSLFDPVLLADTPDIVLVQGDTTTAMASALGAFYHGIPVGHIEAGLRSYDRGNPYPEEMNRRMITLLADWHFAPTARAKAHLAQEGIDPARIFVTGNTVVDALRHVEAERAWNDPLASVPLEGRRLILVTAHRRENWGKPLRQICQALQDLTHEYSDVSIAFPVHLNPQVKRVVHDLLEGEEHIHLLPPLDYLSFIGLMRQATLILTDSGGVQEEAPSFKKPVLVLRSTTERPEAEQAGYAKVIGTARRTLVTEVSRLLDDSRLLEEMVSDSNPFGDGYAADRIIDILKQHCTEMTQAA